MRFKIFHLLCITALAGVVTHFYLQSGAEYLEIKILEIRDDQGYTSLMWNYQNCPVADSVYNSSTLETALILPGYDLNRNRFRGGEVVRLQYRKQPPWPLAPQEPWQAVLQHLGFDQQHLVLHNGFVVSS